MMQFDARMLADAGRTLWVATHRRPGADALGFLCVHFPRSTRCSRVFSFFAPSMCSLPARTAQGSRADAQSRDDVI